MPLIKALAIFLLGTIVLLLAIMGVAIVAHSQGPSVVIAPNGAITYIYPGTNGLPTVIIPPSGTLTYVYPSPPVSVPAPVYTPPVYTPPALSLPSFDWSK